MASATLEMFIKMVGVNKVASQLDKIEKGARDLCELNKDVQRLTWKRIDPPKPLPPRTVNVDAEALPADPQLKGQKILPESELQQLEL